MSRDGVEVTSTARSFHVRALATRKARRPIVGSLTAGTSGLSDEEDCSLCWVSVVYVWQDGGLQCPTCKSIYGVKRGDCPDGVMSYQTINNQLPGYEGYAAVEIVYHISSGYQASCYTGTYTVYKCWAISQSLLLRISWSSLTEVCWIFSSFSEYFSYSCQTSSSLLKVLI